MLNRLPARALFVALLAVLVMGASLSATLSAQSAPPKQPPKTPPSKGPLPTGPGGGLDMSKLPKTLKVPETFEGLFAERDARAVSALEYLQCMHTTVNALRAGALGAVPTDWSITCIKQGNEWRGVFGTLNEQSIDVRLQFALRTPNAVITRDRIDTARVNGTARALLRGLAAAIPGKGEFEVVPVPLPQTKFVEVWFLPVPANPTRAIVGGDSLIQMSSDGTRELGHSRSTPPFRRFSVPLQGSTWTLPSVEERIPTVSELMLAHMTLDLLPEVRVHTNQYDSVLKRGVSGWTHVKH